MSFGHTERISSGGRSEQTIHHPALTNTEKVRVEETSDAYYYDDVEGEEELMEEIDEEILY